jgi:hypothetical protein
MELFTSKMGSIVAKVAVPIEKVLSILRPVLELQARALSGRR